jgi:hypothetical protein
MDLFWIKHVKLKQFGLEVMRRHRLHSAGYQLFNIFKVYEAKKDLPENLRDAFIFAKAVATSPPTWDVHPLTRDPDIPWRRVDLDENLINSIF